MQTLLDELFKTHDRHSKDNWKRNKETIKRLMFSRLYYAISYDEYCLFGLDHTQSREKLQYVGWLELEHYYEELNRIGRPEIFNSKCRTYEYFREYYHRDLAFISSKQQADRFLAFLEKHPSCIIKPNKNYGGHGVEQIHASDRDASIRLWDSLCDRTPFVLEELIEQAPEIDAFYPLAVNTIRYNTFFYRGKLTKLQAVFRIGCGGSNVDNATSGGMYTLVDTETGRILGPAKRDTGETFSLHPDTGMQFEGKQIPRWNKLNELLEKIVRVVPEQKQVGWDFALSTDGWVMVEGNVWPALQSFDLDHGLRPLIADTFGQIVHMWK